MDYDAKIAGKYLDYGKYPSGYCLFDTFCPSDEVDEVLENALSWKEYAETLPEEFTEQVQQIWQLWMKNRRELEQIYHTLPTSVFQADLNPTNLLIDENGKFVGVYDFNLCGKDVFLNYLFRRNLRRRLLNRKFLELRKCFRWSASITYFPKAKRRRRLCCIAALSFVVYKAAQAKKSGR